MGRAYSPELTYALNEALDSSELLGEPLNSLHVLFSLYMLDNSGGLLLAEEGYSEEALLPYVDKNFPETEEAVEELLEIAEETSVKYRNPKVNCLHLLVALTRHRQTRAYHLFERAGVRIPYLRNQAVSLLVNKMPRRYASIFEQHRRRQVKKSTNPSMQSQPAPRAQTVAAPQVTTVHSTRKAVPASGAFPVLQELATDMVEKALNGLLEPVVGRDREIEELVDILNKRKSNNPLVIGPPGIGKTVLVEGLAWRLAHMPDSVPGMESRRIYQLEPSRLLQGTQLRGSFSERIDALRREVSKANGQVILFFDEIHQIAQGSVDGSQDIAQELKSALASGDFPCIGATTTDEYRKTIEKDPALSRRFHLMEIDEPDERETRAILRSVADRYEDHHGTAFTEPALRLAARLTDRYMRDQHQPDKSLTILDLAGSRARRSKAIEVTEEHVAEVVSQLTKVPVEHLLSSDSERYLSLESRLANHIVGHRDTLKRLGESLRRNVAGFSGDRPTGSFLFVGPTGVGKTEIAKALAAELFGQRDAMIRFDMSEFSESHSIAKLIGAPPGYVGFNDGAALTDAIRRHPFQIVLFDEIEKSHPDVQKLLLQILEDGRLSDNMARVADFTHSVVILTSNLGAEFFGRGRSGIGFADEENEASRLQEKIHEVIHRSLSPELFNRIDEVIVFGRLTREEVRQVALLLLQSSASKLATEKNIELQFAPEVTDALIHAGGYDPRFGARPMRRAIQSEIEGPVASMILRGDAHRGQCISVFVDETGGLCFKASDEEREASRA